MRSSVREVGIKVAGERKFGRIGTEKYDGDIIIISVMCSAAVNPANIALSGSVEFINMFKYGFR